MSSEATRKCQTFSDDQAKDLYERYISSMNYEGELINRRTSWLLAVQAFLIAAVAAIQAGSIPGIDALKELFTWVIFVIGFTSAYVTGIGVIAAKWAADYYRNTLDRLSTSFAKDSHVHCYPELSRYKAPELRPRWSWRFGRISDCSHPWLICGGWIGLALLLEMGDYPKVATVVVGLVLLLAFGLYALWQFWIESRFDHWQNRSPASIVSRVGYNRHAQKLLGDMHFTQIDSVTKALKREQDPSPALVMDRPDDTDPS